MRRTSRAFALVPAALAVAAALSCSSGPPSVGARLGSPTDIVVFSGITNKYATLHDYFAVPSIGNGDVVFIDPQDDQPVLGPAVVFPLSITTDPHAFRVAAASLGDRATGGADLLVAVTASSLDLQVIETWTAANRVVPSASVSLGPIVGEGDILAVGALTAPGAAPGNARARALVSVSGGRLVVVDFTRDAQTGAVVPQQPVVKTIGVDAVAIAVEPGGTRAFMATRDPMAGSGTASVFGVAMVDAGVDPTAAWSITPLDAKGPTVALTAALVNERIVDPTNPSAPDTFQQTPQLRIYAVLDPAGCGIDRPIDCGIVTLDDHGLVPDPAGELPYRAPIGVPGIPAGIAVGFPPASGSNRITTDANNPGLPLMLVEPGARNTTAIGVVMSSDGHVYGVDLGRYALINANVTSLGGDSRVAVTNAASALAPDVALSGSADYGKVTQLGLWNDFPVPLAAGAVPVVVNDPAAIPSFIQLTAGYSVADQWFITWQGALPSLVAQSGIVGRATTGETYVAIQANAGTAAQPAWVVGTRLDSPDLGVHGGDPVEIVPDDPTACPVSPDPAHPYPEPSVATDVQILPADPARFPGGAIKLAPGSCFDAALAPGQVVTAVFTVRASGLVLTSHTLGYLGRPTLNQTYLLQYQDETTLSGEALAIARKVRRQFYPVEGPCSGSAPGCYSGYPWLADPLAPGPAMAFRVGLLQPDLPAGAPAPDPTDPAVLQSIARDTRLIIQTQSGMTPTFFRPITGGALPSSAVAYDRTAFAGHENDATRFYAVYLDNLLIDFSPSVSGGDLTTIQ